jgi:hypothetical protein
MAKIQMLSQQTFPSSEADHQDLPVEPTETATAEIATSTFTNPVLPPDLLARGEDTYYAHHWGINE